MPDHKVHIVYQLGGGEQVATQATGQAMAVVVITKHHITRRLQSAGNVPVTAPYVRPSHATTKPQRVGFVAAVAKRKKPAFARRGRVG